MKNISVKYFEFGPVVQGRCCLTDIPIFSSGEFKWQSGTLCAFLAVVIMRNSSA